MQGAADEVSGLLLCRAGPHRLAFLAREVSTIVASSHTPCPNARIAYALPAVPGRVLFNEAGAAVTVDTLEVSQDALRMMSIPSLVTGQAGGSLFGFVSTAEGLWPVMRLPEFSDFLRGVAGTGAAHG